MWAKRVSGGGRQQGLTLLELMISLAVGATLLGVALPGFGQLIARHRANAALADLHAAIDYTRGEAVRRAAQVTLCRRDRSSGPPVCASGGHDWSQGWLVFVDRSWETGSHDPVMGEVLQVHESLDDHASLSFNAPRGASLTFDGQGWPDRNFVGGSFTVCPRSYPQYGQKLIASRFGRLRVEQLKCVS